MTVNPPVTNLPVTMRALEQTSLRGPQDMRLITDAPVPVPGRGEVLIRVDQSGPARRPQHRRADPGSAPALR